MRKIIVCVGIPTSGKSTWSRKMTLYNWNAESLSRDEVREAMYGVPFNYSKVDEQKVTAIFDRIISNYMDMHYDTIILDNTHCKESYITNIIEKYKESGYEVYVKFFDIPMWKAYYRNIMRYMATGKWIPFNVLKNMKKNYDKIDKNKYYAKHMVFI